MKKFVVAAAGLVMAAGGFSVVNVGTAEAQAQTRGAPRGSYTQSCTGSYVNRGRLYADCRDMRGNVRETSIELSRCSNDEIVNRDGRLACGRVQGDFENSGRPGRPGGGWNDDRPGQGSGWNQSSITVYRDANYRGQSMSFRDEIPNLRNVGMNDAISSIRLSRGSWEVCEDANYRGRCEVVRGDVRDLRNTGMNDKISSLRPARAGGRW
ncbi:beta/gamma crystallin-related protein [Brevundimonas guildfordensis]|uniref:Peptidase inhibitor family I36 protein n=1 Tax=Brevundimonas guildfordensis TaxID=2762241 RepID=A0ABR8QZK5_9CAUL|nr:beta/gamma crystallin-related protein [Brevundimonas guildfordensis]MBD7940951.1 peptidase inhibitor family I36 protein [Brevundimonas guildfordensis]